MLVIQRVAASATGPDQPNVAGSGGGAAVRLIRHAHEPDEEWAGPFDDGIAGAPERVVGHVNRPAGERQGELVQPIDLRPLVDS